MPLKPSGKTPTSSPERSSTWAFAGQARVWPILRAIGPSTGISYTRSAPSSRRFRWAGCSSCSPAWSMSASTGSVPEWLATTSAGPASGTCASPCIWTPNQCWYRARAAGISTRLLNSGSKPNWSTSLSPSSWRRANSRTSATRLRQPRSRWPAPFSWPTSSPPGAAAWSRPFAVTELGMPVRRTGCPSIVTPVPVPPARSRRMPPAAAGGLLTVSPSRVTPRASAHGSSWRRPGQRRPTLPVGQPVLARPQAPTPALLLVPPLDTRLPQQLAVLLLGHSLAALLNDGAHDTTLARRFGTYLACLRTPDAGRQGTRQRFRLPPLLPPYTPRSPHCHRLPGPAHPVAPLSSLRRTSPAGTG